MCMNRDRERIYKHTYVSLKIHALRHNGFLTQQDFTTLNLPTTPDVLEDVLAQLQVENQLKLIQQQDGEWLYDFLGFLEQASSESALDMAMRMELAKIYVQRRMWTPAITELRMTRTHPKYKKESLYLLGTCFEHKGAVEKAQEQYERVLAIDYFYHDTLERLNAILERAKRQTTLSSTAIFQTDRQEANHLLQDRYEIVRELGRGSAGTVYQAVDLKLKRDVAVKVLYKRTMQKGAPLTTFLQEARLTAKLDHPNVVAVYDVDTELQCIAMEFVDGGTLQDRLTTHKRLTLEQARTVIIQLCQGLQCAHNAGVLHRDIKPANIFITRKGRVKLGDFGIAHLVTREQDAFTQLSAQIGTLPYMSPEQVRGDRLTAASDIYAVGIVFYEMLTGSPPFLKGDIAYHHLHSQPQSPEIQPDIDAIILQCLEKAPNKRIQSAEELYRIVLNQSKAEQTRLNTYRELLKMAAIDQTLSKGEILVLKMKQQSLRISEQEARRIQQELGMTLP
ncbi:hypothetical protein CSA56_10885 [candidate division KSB3 bacterium]|uniref:non-specific serine/threonine protein kinase n=1 Tax=candidate division KSB3 bacterium TaxID=2044937 RepID=A0A2G6KD50_9BACT|nr:MAG: hypothetical protein CSA56_10885 [candidate division KSB3 bacterium]